MSARRLRPYFQLHFIVVLTNHPLQLILQKPEALGRLTKWCIEFSKFDITYRPRPAIKAQVLADFISEFTPEQVTSTLKTPVGHTIPEEIIPAIDDELQFNHSIPVWRLYVDDASNSHGSGAEAILMTPHTESPDMARLEYALQFNFKASNKEAEYEALLAGLRTAQHMGAAQLQVFSDS